MYMREREREREGREGETDLLLWIPSQICKLVQEMHTKELHHRQNPTTYVVMDTHEHEHVNNQYGGTSNIFY